MEGTTSTPTEEVKISPVGNTKPKGGKNKDGFVAGQVVESKDYQLHMAKQRLKK